MNLTVLTLLFFACGRTGSPAQKSLPETVKIDVDGPVKLVLLGDTGTVGDQGKTPQCDGQTEGKIGLDKAGRERMIASIRRENADAILALGDLVYPEGPECTAGSIPPQAKAEMDRVFGDYIGQLGALSLVVLGNHDVNHDGRGNAKTEACFRNYAAARSDLHMPERNYIAEVGKVRIGVVDTNRLPGPGLAKKIADEMVAGPDSWWRVMAGHHVLRTYQNKEDQDRVAPWLAANDISPDLWVNGHAHLLQFGVYDVAGKAIPAATSGTGAKVRCRSECGSGSTGPCGAGQQWGRSEFGYATVAATEQMLRVSYKNTDGKTLWCWQRDRGTAVGQECP